MLKTSKAARFCAALEVFWQVDSMKKSKEDAHD